MATDVRTTVRDRYGKIAREKGSGCCGGAGGGSSCCGTATEGGNIETSRKLGYTAEALASIPVTADLGLGCGNPTAIGSIAPGETVIDLGSGGGIDCFLAARQVGPEGRVIGVDMTPDMIDRAREAAREGGFDNVEFRLGEIENLPVADGTADLILSNCVINLSPDKPAVFGEAFRVLKPGGRMMISDIVTRQPLPEALQASLDLYVGCVAGALEKEVYLGIVREAGFTKIDVVSERPAGTIFSPDDPVVREIIKENGLNEADIARLAGDVVSLELRITR